MNERRHRRIGGSDLATLCGFGNFGNTPLDLYRQIVFGVSTFSGNRYTRRGQKEEPNVRALYLRTYGFSQQPSVGCVEFEECFACTPDDIVRDRAGKSHVVDYKTASANSLKKDKKWGASGSSDFPKNYQTQLTLYMAALDLHYSELFCQFGIDGGTEDAPTWTPTETRRYVWRRELVFEKFVLDCGRKFWTTHIVPKTPPLDVNSKGVPNPNPLIGEKMPDNDDLFDLEVPLSVEEELKQIAPAPVIAPRQMPEIQSETPEEAAAAKAAFEKKGLTAASAVQNTTAVSARRAKRGRHGRRWRGSMDG